MKPLISDCIPTTKGELSVQTRPTRQVSIDIGAEAELLSDESKLWLLTYSYLELNLNLEQAQRAASADLMTSKAQTHRQWAAQPQ